MNKILILGATSGIGKELAKIYASSGNIVGITGRRSDLLDSIKKEFPQNIFTKCFDITSDECESQMQSLINEMGGMDLCIISSGIGFVNPELVSKLELDTLNVNVVGFARAAIFAYNFFKTHGRGHLAGISSIAGLRQSSHAPAYASSKAFERFYLKSLRDKAFKDKAKIYFTEILPGFVDTALLKSDKLFWVQPPEKAALQIVNALNAKRKKVYITKRWFIVAMLMKALPQFIYKRV